MRKLNKLAKFLESISSLICLYPNENSRKITLPSASISGALKRDWENIGLDMWKVYQEIELQNLEIKQHPRDNDDRFERSTRPYR